MAKIALKVTLKKNDGSTLLAIQEVVADTKSAAEASIAASIQTAVNNAQQNAQDFADAQTAFNS